MSTARPRLAARPGRPSDASRVPHAPGLHPLGLEAGSDPLLYVPAALAPDAPSPLLVMLHGAGSDGRAALAAPVVELAERASLLLLAPSSRGSTWDAIRGGFGPDVRLLDAALDVVFSRYPVDPSRLALGGFSDGASYALSLGLGNGHLFSHLVAFSPGFIAPAEPVGRPPVFVSHGRRDAVLPIDRCSRRIVPRLRDAGYEVHYVEFDGGHEVPALAVRAAARWIGVALD